MFFTVYMTFYLKSVSIPVLNLAQLKKYPHLLFSLLHYILNLHQLQQNQSTWVGLTRANARNVSFQKLYEGQFTLSPQLILNSLLYSPTIVAPRFL